MVVQASIVSRAHTLVAGSAPESRRADGLEAWSLQRSSDKRTSRPIANAEAATATGSTLCLKRRNYCTSRQTLGINDKNSPVSVDRSELFSQSPQ